MKQGLRWLDSDMHLAEPWDLWYPYVEPAFRDHVEAVTGVGPGYFPLTHGPASAIRDIRKGRLADFLPYLNEAQTHVDPAGQLRAMDTEGIDAAVLFPTIALRSPDDSPPGAAMATRRAFNSWLADFCAYEPARLKLNAAVPLHDVNAAVAELRRVMALGAVSFMPDPRPDGAAFDDPLYEPIWAEAEALGLAVDFHNGIPGQLNARYSDRPSHIYLHASQRPVGHMCTFMELLYGGVLERHPRLHVVFLEAGASWVPYWLFRLEEEWERFRDLHPGMHENVTMPPIEYWKRQCYCSVEVGEWSLPGVVATIGDDNLVVSSDFPHFDCDFPEAGNHFLELAGVSHESKRKILWDNCARLYHLDS
jgi:predicted TIM-barrel fold metal-dependent hydrolase